MSKPKARNGPPAFTPKQGQYLAFVHAYTQLQGRATAEADLQTHLVAEGLTLEECLRAVREYPVFQP